MKISFSPPYIDQDVVNEVVGSLQAGWITIGPKVKALQNEIKRFTGTKEVLCVNLWTPRAIMMLKCWGVKEGDY
jgi:dTDP-4-amino-4,6-dideoxygalactose transaminase